LSHIITYCSLFMVLEASLFSFLFPFSLRWRSFVQEHDRPRGGLFEQYCKLKNRKGWSIKICQKHNLNMKGSPRKKLFVCVFSLFLEQFYFAFMADNDVLKKNQNNNSNFFLWTHQHYMHISSSKHLAKENICTYVSTMEVSFKQVGNVGRELSHFIVHGWSIYTWIKIPHISILWKCYAHFLDWEYLEILGRDVTCTTTTKKKKTKESV